MTEPKRSVAIVACLVVVVGTLIVGVGQGVQAGPPQMLPTPVAMPALNENVLGTEATGESDLVVSAAQTYSILTIDLGVYENHRALDLLGLTYTKVSPAQFRTVNLRRYDVLYVGWTAEATTGGMQTLYDRRNDIRSFVYAGGNLVALANRGYTGYEWLWIPVSLSFQRGEGNNLSIAQSAHPIVQGLTDDSLSGWYNSYHTRFIGDTRGLDTVTIELDTPQRDPVTLAGAYGAGRMVLSGQDPDWHVVYGHLAADRQAAKRHLRKMLNWAGSTSLKTLARRYTPYVYLHPREKFPPTRIGVFLDHDNSLLNCTTTACTDLEHPIWEPQESTLDNLWFWRAESESYLDLPGRAIRGSTQTAGYVRRFNLRTGGDRFPPTAYVRFKFHSGSTDFHTVIQYWFVYYYNPRFTYHEGDWEMVQVVLDRDLRPKFATYAQHMGRQKKPWANVLKVGTHPKVFVALGSHASYFRDRTYCLGYEKTGADVIRSLRLVYLPAERTQFEVGATGWRHRWLAYAGRWGEPGAGAGPAFQGRKWSSPYLWGRTTGGLRCPETLPLGEETVAQEVDH